MNPDYQFFIFLLTGSKEETERIADSIGACEREEELIQKLKQVGILSVGMTPDDYISRAADGELEGISPEREKLITRLIKEYFESRRLAWEGL